jgi:hypothetical protein
MARTPPRPAPPMPHPLTPLLRHRGGVVAPCPVTTLRERYAARGRLSRTDTPRLQHLP